VIDGQEGHLSHTFTITIAPVSSIDATSFSRSRRPSLVNEPPKRSTSDSVLFQAPQRSANSIFVVFVNVHITLIELEHVSSPSLLNPLILAL